jgi:hypothetical protein
VPLQVSDAVGSPIVELARPSAVPTGRSSHDFLGCARRKALRLRLFGCPTTLVRDTDNPCGRGFALRFLLAGLPREQLTPCVDGVFDELKSFGN